MKSDFDFVIEYVNDMIKISEDDRDKSKIDSDFNFYDGRANAYRDVSNVVTLMKAVKGE